MKQQAPPRETPDVVVGNYGRKYDAKNPAVRFLTNRWVNIVDDVFRSVHREMGTTMNRALEVGCGEGVFAERLHRLWPSVTALDLPDAGLRRDWQGVPGPHFLHASTYQLPFPDTFFDIVVAIEVLEHVDEPRQALDEICRVTTGHMVLSVPHEPFFRGSNLLAGRYVSRLGNTPGHVQNWSRRGFLRFVSQVADVRGVWSPFPWTVVWATLRPSR